MELIENRRRAGGWMLALLLAATGAAWLAGCSDPPAPPEALAAASEYYCPMHQQVVKEEPGKCPICGMDLAEREKGTAEDVKGTPAEATERPPGAPHGQGEVGRAVDLSPAAMEAAGVGTVPAERKQLRREIRATGTIEADETRATRIAARVAGRLERLHLDFTGQQVGRGAPIYSIFSPELLAAQRELLLALDNLGRAQASGSSSYAASAEALVQASRDRLRLWGIEDDQIARLEQSRSVETSLVVRSPVSGTVVEKLAVPGQYVTQGQDLYLLADLSRVWLQARIYEPDLGAVRLGQQATATLDAMPGREFKGRVRFIDPVVDPATRTARVRIELPNANGALKPGMFAHAELQLDLGERLVVPRSALLDTGTRQVVYVKTGDASFAGREVRVGEHAGDLVEVVEGLAEGEEVVAAASFLVDSQSQLQTGASVQWGGASEVKSE